MMTLNYKYYGGKRKNFSSDARSAGHKQERERLDESGVPARLLLVV